jgi:lipopolysaccharide/colanic/teichoic acid biosynthesis glycosyltransferase
VDILLRSLDVAISAGTLLVLSPLLVLTALAIFVTSGRPVFYRGARVGRAGHLFWMYKFRTLKADAEDRLGPYYGEELTRRTEEERTLIGGALRSTHLDEVPQLWNVLRGDMAIVGPRPIRPAFFAELCREIPQYWQRLVVRPGVTGFAQTRVTREESWANKLAHDMEFIADRSVGLTSTSSSPPSARSWAKGQRRRGTPRAEFLGTAWDRPVPHTHRAGRCAGLARVTPSLG